MSKKPTEPSHEQIVNDFDKYLMENIPGFLDKDNITVVREISNKWRELRNGYIEYLIKKCNELKLRK